MTVNRQGLEDRLVVLTARLRSSKEAMEAFIEVLDQERRDRDPNRATEQEQLKAENAQLRAALASCYSPTDEEWLAFDAHCFDTNAAGGAPPDEVWHWSERALFEWGRHNGA